MIRVRASLPAALGLVVLLASPAAAATRSIDQALDRARPARAPFTDLTQTRVHVGEERLRVVVADDEGERVQGLRARADIGRYDGMLFVFDGPTSTGFTMSTVPVALDIGFYDDDGRVVDRLRMEPCPDDESECPVYRADGEFTYALETLADDLPRGRLTG